MSDLPHTGVSIRLGNDHFTPANFHLTFGSWAVLIHLLTNRFKISPIPPPSLLLLQLSRQLPHLPSRLMYLPLRNSNQLLVVLLVLLTNVKLSLLLF